MSDLVCGSASTEGVVVVDGIIMLRRYLPRFVSA